MPNPLQDWVLPAARARFVLLANHVLAASPAPQRLKAHAQRLLKIEVQGWRLPLPPPPPLLLRITPAGLLEAVDLTADGVEPAADLRLAVDAADPLAAARRVASGELPPVQIEGDAGLAADVNWVMAHVRWDIAADLERVFGPVVAEAASRVGEQAGAAWRALAQGVAGVMQRP